MQVFVKAALFVLSSIVLSGVSAAASNLVPFSPGLTKKEQKCSLVSESLPSDTIVIAASDYMGTNLGFQIDESGQRATKFDVAVHADKPVALLLSAQEPSVWMIGWTEQTRIVAVFVTGRHRQAVAGLPDNVPVRISTYENKGACGNFVSYEGDFTWVNPLSRKVFGKEATKVYPSAKQGSFTITESSSKTPPSMYFTSTTVTPESFRLAGTPLSGKEGLAEAVNRGELRAVTDSDIEMVKKHYQKMAASKPKSVREIPPVAGASRSMAHDLVIPLVPRYESYVVLKPFKFPTGLNVQTFVVPKGILSPTGNPGNSMVLDLNRPKPCYGPPCLARGYQ